MELFKKSAVLGYITKHLANNMVEVDYGGTTIILPESDNELCISEIGNFVSNAKNTGGGLLLPRKKTFYHGVKKAENVDKILKEGFKLSAINPLWTNDYAISVLSSPGAIKKYFGSRPVPIIEIKFDGVIAEYNAVSDIQPFGGHKEYTRQVVERGIDAVRLGGAGGQYFIYNPSAIKNIKLFNPNEFGNGGHLELSADGQPLLAPNGQPSKLNPVQYKLVRTPEFKAWFGDWERVVVAVLNDSGIDDITLANISKGVSKIVDENGEPLVVYHGTKQDFSEFKYKPSAKRSKGKRLGWPRNSQVFTDNTELASNYAGTAKTANTQNEVGWFSWPPEDLYGGSIMPVFLNIADPLIIDAQNGVYYNYERPAIYQAKKEGHDGVVLKNLGDAPGTAGSWSAHLHTEYITFDTNQIKSAMSNSGQFSKFSNDIQLASGGHVPNIYQKGWHFTSIKNLPSIFKQGLLVSKANEVITEDLGFPAIWLHREKPAMDSNSMFDIDSNSYGVYLVIDLDKMPANSIEDLGESEGALLVKNNIPKSAIQKIIVPDVPELSHINFGNVPIEYLQSDFAAGGKIAPDNLSEADLNIIGLRLKANLRTNEAYVFLDSDKQLAGSDWSAGACLPLARALQLLLGGTVVCIKNNSGIVQHVMLKIGTKFLDSDGYQSGWKKINNSLLEGVDNPRLAPVTPLTDLGELGTGAPDFETKLASKLIEWNLLQK